MESAPTNKAGLRVFDLPESLRPSVRDLAIELDTNGDGVIDEEELVMAINNLKSTRDQNRNLTKIIGGLLGGMLLLSATVFGTSIAAAHLSKDTSIDSHGVLHDKHTGAVVQVSESIEWTPDKIIVDMNNRELGNLKKIALLNGDLQFQVKGYARHLSSEVEDKKVILLVEGGTVTYDKEGVADAAGDALSLINAVLGVVEIEGTEGNGGRKLCNDSLRPKEYSNGMKRKLSIGTIHRKLCGYVGDGDDTSTAQGTSGTDVATTSGTSWPHICGGAGGGWTC